jgi:hypothetical protein
MPRCAAAEPPADAGSQARAMASTRTDTAAFSEAETFDRTAPVDVVAGPGYTTALPELGDDDEPADHEPVIRRSSMVGDEPKPTRTWLVVWSFSVAETSPRTFVPGMLGNWMSAR